MDRLLSSEWIHWSDFGEFHAISQAHTDTSPCPPSTETEAIEEDSTDDIFQQLAERRLSLSQGN